MKPLLTPEIIENVAWAELFFILFASAGMVLFKLLDIFRFGQVIKLERALSKILYNYVALGSDAPFSVEIPRKMRVWRVLLPTLEKIKLQFKGGGVEPMSQALANAYLRPLAKRWAYEHTWKKRNAACRIYFLAPLKGVDDKEVTHLLNDKSFLNRSVAAHAAVKIGTRALIEEVLLKMGEEPEVRRYTFRHALMTAPPQVYEIVKEIYLSSKNTQVRVACIDALSHRLVSNPLEFAKKDLDNPSPQIRLQIAKMAESFQSEHSAEIFIKYLEDPSSAVRTVAAKSLGDYSSGIILEKLAKALNDPSWDVRVNAALSLKKQGHEGIQILKSITSGAQPSAYEVARTVLTMP
ncbi:MAG: HEAT repeat domain-containing protein [Chlamydiia bacterium]|nr:HEAT repeat domain-containing protein [Chlamydiia bacterium]